MELQARPGGRTELRQWLETLVQDHGPGQLGFLGSTRYEVLDVPDMLVEIADWESAEARSAHMKASAATGVYAPLAEMLAAPVRATVISRDGLRPSRSPWRSMPVGAAERPAAGLIVAA